MDHRLTEASFLTMLSALADMAMPRACVVCGHSLLIEEKDICMECLADLPRTRFAGMRINPMADSFNSLMEKHIPEGNLGVYVRCTALFYYVEEDDYSRITQALKYNRNFHAGRLFASMLADEMSSSGLYDDVDCIVPVPLHWTRRLSRGYNQAEIIARAMQSRLGGSARTCLLLKRSRRTRSQVHVDMDSKAANVLGAFILNKRAVRHLPNSPRHILLVDDVYTSGSTLFACWTVLHAHYGPQLRVSVATLAYVSR